MILLLILSKGVIELLGPVAYLDHHWTRWEELEATYGQVLVVVCSSVVHYGKSLFLRVRDTVWLEAS